MPRHSTLARPARKCGAATRELICETASSTPSALGLPFATWTLTKLAAYYRLPVCAETIRRVLRAAGISSQATNTSW
jgi:hypothetical protein